jgi:hypothetical protein
VERRRGQRYEGWLPVKINGSEQALAVSHNASSTGLLLVTAVRLTAGEQIDLQVQLPYVDEPIDVKATIVRAGSNENDPRGLWPFTIAVEFERAVPEIEAAVRNG